MKQIFLRSVDMLQSASVVYFLFLCSIYEIRAQHGVVQELSPCPSQVLIMARTIGGPPGHANRWFGRVRLDNWPEIDQIILTLTFDAQARVVVDDTDGNVQMNGDYHIITYYTKPESRNEITFEVVGTKRTGFPNPVNLYLNGEEVCERVLTNAESTTSQETRKPTTKPKGTNNGAKPEKSTAKPVKTTARMTTQKNHNKPPTSAPYVSSTVRGVDTVDSRLTSKCGKRMVQHQGLVTNGYPSHEGDWPWHAGIYHRKTPSSFDYRCGGTLISSQFVITAGHCVTESGNFIVEDRILVKLGVHSRKIGSQNTREFEVYAVIPHEEYDFNDLKHDIALLHLATKVSFSNYIQPVCLWPSADIALENVINKNGIVVGWGLNEEDTLSDILTQGSMPVVSLTTCLESNRDFFGVFLSDYNYCAGFRNGTSVCNGDSGGGMVFERSNIYYLRGIVSLSVSRGDKDICNPKQYVLFTDVAKYSAWIENKMK